MVDFPDSFVSELGMAVEAAYDPVSLAGTSLAYVTILCADYCTIMI